MAFGFVKHDIMSPYRRVRYGMLIFGWFWNNIPVRKCILTILNLTLPITYL